jgi:ABC-type branched-subunit amino acid transport system substrate-binding protein
VRLGILTDFPQRDGADSFVHAVRLGLDAVGVEADTVDIRRELTVGHPTGTPAAVVAGAERLADAGVSVIIGPSITDNTLAVRDAVERWHVPAINYTGGDRTRSRWMFHYQVGSLEDEPHLLAARLAERGLGRVAVLHDRSVVGDRYREVLGWAATERGLTVTRAVPVDPTATDLAAAVATLRTSAPEAVVYLGLGAVAHAVATAIADASWSVPVVANSALMFGYARPDWRDAWAGWEYVDTLADDNRARRALAAVDARVAAGPIGCAAYDIGRLVGLAASRADGDGPGRLGPALEHVRQVPAASGHDGTLMGFGAWDRAALKGDYLVLRTWRDGRSVPVVR